MRIAVVVVLVVAAVYGAVSWLFADKLIGQQFLPPDDEANFADFGLPDPEKFTATNRDTQLAGWYFPNPRSAGCAAVVLHGFTGNKAQMLGPASSLFFERGCNVVVYDHRGHGESSRGFITYGALERFEQLAVVDWLAQRTGLPESKVGLWGVSYGAATSLQAASERPGLAFVIADASISSLADIAAVQADKQYGTWARLFVPGALFISGLRGGFDPAQASPQDAVRDLATPVLLVHSTTDEFTPVEHSEAIYANSDPARTTLHLTRYGAPHGESFWTDPVAHTRFVDEFLDTFVPNFGSREATSGGG